MADNLARELPADSALSPERPWHIRPFRPGDEPQLLSLYAAVFGRSRPLAELRWKLIAREFAFPTVFVAALHDDTTLVGHYGGIPFQLKTGERIVQALQVVESMTHPDFMRQGMLTVIGGAAHSAWSSVGVTYITGLPNQQWGTRKRALGYSPLFPMAWLRFPLRPDAAMARRHGLPSLGARALSLPIRGAAAAWAVAHRLRAASPAYKLTMLGEHALDTIDEVWRRIAPTYEFSLVRDADWVRWRYLLAEPRADDVLVARQGDRSVGYIAFRAGVEPGENGVIADLCTASGDINAARALIAGALDALGERRAAMVAALAAPGSPLYATLRRSGFLPASAATAFSFEMVALQPGEDVAGFSNPADWLITGGDFDVV